MDISENIKASLNSMNFKEPTEIQEKAIPVIMESKDVIIKSKTGSGKTGAYMIPLMNSIENIKGKYVKALIVLPTRELALQTHKVAVKMGKSSKLKSVIVYGGVSISNQIKEIPSADIIIGTPGRLLDLINQGYLDIKNVKFLVLDEADLMFDMGFIDDIKKLIKIPLKKQSVLLSATIPKEIMDIAKKFMNTPEFISAGENESIPLTIKHLYTFSEKFNKFSTLLSYLNAYKSKKSIIFVKTQRSGDLLNNILYKSGFKTILIHGGMKQNSRERSINDFRNLDAGILVATNVAARGLDIPNITDIINFDAPETVETYTHRVGRSGRMGKDGRAMTIFDEGQRNLISSLQKRKVKLEKIDVNLEEKYTDINYGELITQFNREENNKSESRSNGRRYSGGNNRNRRSETHRTESHRNEDHGNYREETHRNYRSNTDKNYGSNNHRRSRRPSSD